MLDGTTAEIVERKALRINAATTCHPIAAMYAPLEQSIGEAAGGAWWSDDDIAASAEALAARARDYL